MTKLSGWTGKILDVDLSAGTVTTIDTADYVPKYVGGLGIAARIAWDSLRPGVGPFDPESPLFLMLGPLTGTLASGGGRVIVAGIAPQQRPSVFSRSGIGGHWGAELKYAGFDGVMLRGRASSPVYLWVQDGVAEIREADDLWGLGTYATTARLRDRHGAKTRVVACGQAGERLARIACIQTETGNAAGQGGYGAVMGSKNLKALAARGTGGVRVADPSRLLDLTLHASREGQRARRPGGAPRRPQTQDPGVNMRGRKCGFCASDCGGRHFSAIPGEGTSGTYTADWYCYNYASTSIRAHVEGKALTSDYGLNGWEISFGIIPWLQMCRQHGLIDEIDGLEIPVPEKPIQYRSDAAEAPVSGAFLVNLLHKIAFREGELGDALADGACYAAYRLLGGEGIPLLHNIYPRHAGQTSHWNAHWGTGGNIYFPFWLTPILQWCVDTRDPASDCTHGYSTHMLSYLPKHGPLQGPMSVEQARAVCDKVYGNADVCDASLSYEKPESKAIPAIFHHDRGMLVESLILCDKEHSRVFSLESEDGRADTALMAKLYSACTGQQASEEELEAAGARTFNLLRAIDIRNHDRSREIDWRTAEDLTHPAFTDGVVLNLERFAPMLDCYYELRGWNPENGWPTRTKLESLELQDVADSLEKLGRLG